MNSVPASINILLPDREREKGWKKSDKETLHGNYKLITNKKKIQNTGWSGRKEKKRE